MFGSKEDRAKAHGVLKTAAARFGLTGVLTELPADQTPHLDAAEFRYYVLAYLDAILKAVERPAGA